MIQESVDAAPLSVAAAGEPRPLQVFVRAEEGRTRVIVVGELDDSTAPDLRAQLAEVAIDPASDLVLDIGLLTFVDSTGLALFVAQHKKLRAQGSRLTLSSPSPMARRLLEITGLTQILSIEPLA